MQSDCDDLRITDTNGKLLPHNVQSDSYGCNDTDTRIWVKTPSITTSGATVFVYYGNPSASTRDRIDEVFNTNTTLAYEFASDTESWTTVNQLTTPTAGAGLWSSTYSGATDPFVYSPASLTITASSSKYVFAKIRVTNGQTGSQLFWITNLDGSYSEAKSTSITNTYNGNWQVLVFQVGADGDWANTVTRFRFDIIGSGTGSIDIDWIRVHNSGATAPSAATPTNEEKGTAPIAYWKFDDATGTNAQDSSTNNNDGTTSGATWTTEDQCISGKCLYLTSTNTVNFGDPSNDTLDMGTGDFSVSYWIRTGTSADNRNLIRKGAGAGTSEFRVGLNSGVPYALLGDSTVGGQVEGSVGSTSIADNKWHHVIVVFNRAGNAVGYVDGTATGTALTISSESASISTSSSLLIGNTYATFTGFMDELKIYNFALTAAQVKANYNAKASGDGASAVLGKSASQGDALSNGLVGYWKMDESSGNAADASGNAQTLTNTNIATFAAGKYGNAGSLASASSQYFTCTDANCGGTTELDVPTTFTASAWVNKPDVTQNYAMIIAKSTGGGDTGNAYELRFNSTTGKIQFVSYIGGAYQSIASNTALTNSTWQHVTVTYDGAYLRLFLNGASDATPVAVTGAMSNSAADFAIGRRADGYYYNGSIDEARVYNRALSPAEVSQLYNFAPGPILYYNLDEGTGTTSVSDTSGNANTGTMNGTMTNSDWVSGKYGKALDFDGTDDWIDAGGSSTILSLQEGTISTWAKFNTTAEADAIGNAGKNGASTSSQWGIQYRGDDTNQIQIYAYNPDGTLALNAASPTNTINDTNWHHIAVVVDSSTVNLYVDGVKQTLTGTVNNTFFGDLASPTKVTFGRHYQTDNPNYLNGQLDDTKIYNYARTAKQIVQDMNAGHPAVGSPVGSAVGHWKFDEGADNTCSGGANDYCNSGSQGSTLDGAKNGTISSTQSGKYGKAISPDGTTGYVSVADNASLDPGTNDFSVSTWVEFPLAGSSVWNGIITKGITTAAPANTWGLWAGNPVTNIVYQDTTNAGGAFNVTVTYDGTLLSSGFHLVTVTRSGTAYVMYIDGISRATGTGLATVNLANANNLQFANADSRYFSKDIDEVKIYNFALTADEVKLDMNQGSTQVLGALSDNSSYQKQSANQEYCIPGDSTSCTAPVGRWDFNEGTGTTVNDSSGNGFVGTFSSVPTWTSGKVGKGLNFDGTDDYIDLNTQSATLKPSTALSVSAWVNKSGTLTDFKGIFVGPQTAGTAGGYLLTGITTDKVRMYIDTTGAGGWASATSTTTLASNTWYHVEGTWDGTNVKIYINGILEATTAAATIGYGTTAVDAFIGNYGGGEWPGKLDHVNVFNYARSAAQVAWDYNKGGPVGHWKLDECQGTTAYDLSGNSNTGTITVGATGTYTSMGTCPVSSASTMWYNGATGKRNYSLAFDGTDSYVSVTDSTILKPSIITVAAWIKTTSSDAHIFHKYNPASPFQGYSLRTASGFISFWVGGSAWRQGTTAVNDNSQHLLVGTYDGTNAKVYVDGVLQTTQAQSGTLSHTTNATIGAYNTGASAFLGGQIDDARVYNYALTATQVKQLINEGTTRYAPSTGAP